MVAETVPNPESAPVSAWDRLRDAADVASYRPCLRAGLASQELTTTRGERYVVVQNPDAATYLRLSPEDFFIFQLTDGSRSVQQLAVEYVLKFQRFALQHLLGLVEDLRYNEFLAEAPSYTYPRLRRLARPHSLRASLDNLLNLYLNREFPIRGVDAAFDKLYRGGAWLLLTKPGLILLAAITLAGIPLFARDLHIAHISLTDRGLLARYAAIGYLSLLAIAVIHELAHAFAVKSYGRAVRKGGLGLFYGSPCMYVDTQDMWMASRGPRIAASWAGPYSGFILAGVAGLALTVLPHGGWVTFARAFGITALIENAFQLNPFIQYDGYYILMDLLDIYNLRRRALTFIRFDLRRKLWRRERFSHEEIVFAVFGILAGAYTVFAIFLAVTFGWDHARSAIQSAIRVPNLGSLFLAILLALLLIPFAIGVTGRLIGLVQTLVRSARRAGGAARLRWLRERMTLLAQVPVLARLGEEPIQALAACVREERYPAGQAIVRQGEPGARFYLVAGGTADVTIADQQGSRVVGQVGPMDYFGERALIQSAPRAATVRATSKMRVLSLGADDFRTSIRPYIAADAALRLRLDEMAELERFPLLEPIGARDREVLLSRLRPVEFEAGDEIVRQGERGQDFYLIRSGRADVLRGDDAGEQQLLQTLGPGDFFGEIALVYDTPRVANVRAAEPLRLWRLPRQDFHDLLSRYFDVGEQMLPAVRERLAGDRLMELPSSRTSQPLDSGDAAPEIALSSASGVAVSLAAYRGRRVILWFSLGMATASAQQYLAKLNEERVIERLGASVLAIDPRSPAGGGTEIAEGDTPWTLLYDSEKSSYQAYGMYAVVNNGAEPPATDWSAAMRPLDPAGADGRRTLAAIREGIVVIDAEGRVERIWRRDAEHPLPPPEQLLAGPPT